MKALGIFLADIAEDGMRSLKRILFVNVVKAIPAIVLSFLSYEKEREIFLGNHNSEVV